MPDDAVDALLRKYGTATAEADPVEALAAKYAPKAPAPVAAPAAAPTAYRATPDEAAAARAEMYGDVTPESMTMARDSAPADDATIDALLEAQGHSQRVEGAIAKWRKELDPRPVYPGAPPRPVSDQAAAFAQMGEAEFRRREREDAIRRLGGVPQAGAARKVIKEAEDQAAFEADVDALRQDEIPGWVRYGARAAVGLREQLENAGTYLRRNVIAPAAPEAGSALSRLADKYGMSEEGKAAIRKDTAGLGGELAEIAGSTAAFIPQVSLGGIPAAAAMSSMAAGGDVMAGVETAVFLKSAGALTKLFGGASESVVRNVLAEGGGMTAAGLATRMGFHGDPGTLHQAGVDALTGLAFGVMGAGARAREAAARLKAGLEAGKTIDVAAAEAGIPPERLKAPETAPAERAAPPVEAPAPAPERAPEIAPQSDVVAPRPVEAPAAESPVSGPSRPIAEAPRPVAEAPTALVEAPQTGKPWEGTVYRGKGESGYAAHGEGAYYGMDRPSAERFSEPGTVSETTVALRNPYVIRSDADVTAMRKAASDASGKPINADWAVLLEKNSPESAALSEGLSKMGHDGVIVDFPEAAGGRQVVVLPKATAPAEAPKPPAPEPRPVESAPAAREVAAPRDLSEDAMRTRERLDADIERRFPGEEATRTGRREFGEAVHRLTTGRELDDPANAYREGSADYEAAKLGQTEARNVVARWAEGRPAEATPAEAPRVAERPVEPPKDPTPPVPEAPAAPAPAPEGEGFSIKNAAVAERREARGAEPLEKSTPQTREGWNAEAERQMAENPNRPYEVMADLKRTGKAHTPVEVAILTRHQKNLNVAYKKAYEDITESAKRGDADAVKEAKARAADILLKDIEAAESISGASGSEAGRSLAARQMALAEDYSVLALTRERTIANDGKPLSKEMEAKIADISTRMDNIQRELDAYRAAAAKAEAPRGKTVSVADVKSAEYGKRNTIITRDAYEATRTALRDKLNRMSAGIDPTILADMVKIGAFHVEAGLRNFSAWSKAMIEDLGEKVGPHLKDVWRDSQSKIGKPLADAKAALAEGAKAGKAATDSPAAIQKLAEYYVREGVTDRGELISKVHEALQESSPGITFRQTMDAISGYGVYKQLNNDPAKIRLRELKTEMQQLAKLEDMAEGKAPAKTGVERQEMTDEARRLAREVNEKKREGGYETTDPAKQLKTALESTKTRLRHEIADLSRQIATKTKDIPDKAKVALDPEAQALKKRRDELRAEYQETFGKPGMTDAQRLEAAVRSSERAVAALEKQIERGDVFPESKPAKVTDARLEALKARREELSKRREDLRAAALEGSKPSKVQQSIDRAVAALDKSIVEYKAKLATGNIAPKPKGDGGPTSPKIDALRAERDALRKQMDAARNAARPRLSPEQIARKTRMTRIQRTIDKLEQQIAAKDFTKKAKTVNIPSMVEARLLAKQEMVRQEWQAAKLKDEWQKKSVLQKAGSLAMHGLYSGSRAIMTAWDLSAPGRQGLLLTAAHPIRAARQFIPMLKAFANKEYAAASEAQMHLDPMYQPLRRAGLFLSEHGQGVSRADESMVMGAISKLPGIAGSQRAYTTYLNRLRFDVAKAGLANLSAGKTPTPAEVAAWAKYVNVATGRGGSADTQKMTSQLLNGLSTVFFAPRLAVSRFQILLGEPMWPGRGTMATRGLILKEYLRSAAGLSVFYGLAKLAGGDIEKDGKVRFGKSVIDPTAGMSQALTLLTKTAPGVAKTVSGDTTTRRRYGQSDEYDTLAGYLRKKLGPIPGAGVNLMTGKTAVGEKTTLGKEALSLATPMSTRDIVKAMEEHGIPKGAALSLLSLFGMGLQHYDKRGR